MKCFVGQGPHKGQQGGPGHCNHTTKFADVNGTP